MNKLGTVIAFTYKNKVKTKAFLITTLIMAILICVGANVPYFIHLFTEGKGQNKAPASIGIVYADQSDIAENLQSYIEQRNAGKYHFVKVDKLDETTLNHDVSSGKLDGYIQFVKQEGSNFPNVMYTSKKGKIDSALETDLQTALQGIKTQHIVKQSLTDAQLAELNTPVQIATQGVDDQDKDGKAGSSEAVKIMNYVVVYALLLLFFISIISTGNMIASEVTTEKSSRIMEILITSVSPLNQMFGKIIGMFLVGISQIALYAVVAVINIMLPHNQHLLGNWHLNFSQIGLDVLIYGLIFYVLGYFLYAVLFAAIGSMVSRTEELGQAVLPITMLALVAFYIPTFSLSTPDTLLVKIASFVPFTSPTTMLVRVGLGEVSTWEIFVSLAILAVSILFFGWLSAKIYRTGVLMYGKRPTWKELRKAMKAYKI
ncbi:ABC transporter permease [Paenibacillus sediminis]|uniref:ABC-2 type transport system permease protein n=1 Tax=Paenibacillus sediminis TaxID=664909 RepID=A0ABS4H7R8_9BACL|nr:ABC transporter permease [Paenibacillus sediminis]MBP1938565.1 ABC-2 type transport system permease protein [Paenibacillus sediminis]